MSRVLAFLTALALVVLAAAPALSATYYIRPSGNNLNAGTSYYAAWKTIAKANTTIAAGDIVYLYPGSYTDFPNPAGAGADETNRFTFIGAHTTLDPTADSLTRYSVTIPSGTLSKPFVTLTGLRVGGALTLGPAARKDSLVYLHVIGALNVGDADYCIFDRCTFDGATFYMGSATDEHAIGDEFHGCDFWRLGVNYGSAANVCQLGRSAAAAVTASVDSCVFRFNRFDITLTKDGDPGSHAIVTYAMRDCAWRGNLISVHNLHPTDRWGALILSDSTSRNAFDRDTINASGGPSKVLLSSVSTMTSKTIGRNTLDSCWIKVTDCPASFYGGMNRATLTYSTFVGGGAGLTINRSLGNNLVNHCTIAGGGPGAGIVSIMPTTPGWADNTIFTNNIVYSFDPGTKDCIATSNYRSALYAPIRSIDSTYYGGGAHAAHWRSEGNLYSYYGISQDCAVGADTVGQRSIVFQTPWGDGANRPRPYTLAVSTRAPWDSIWCAGCDDSSRYGSPRFRDSTLTHFDPTLGLNSRATAGAIDGLDIGAVTFAVQAIIALGPPAYFNDYGDAQVRDLSIQNLGTAVLSISHMTPDHSSVSAGQDTLSVGGLATRIVTIAFAPTGDGSAPAIVNVSIASNDPVRPTALWPCYVNQTGGGGEPFPERRP